MIQIHIEQAVFDEWKASITKTLSIDRRSYCITIGCYIAVVCGIELALFLIPGAQQENILTILVVPAIGFGLWQLLVSDMIWRRTQERLRRFLSYQDQGVDPLDVFVPGLTSVRRHPTHVLVPYTPNPASW